MKSLHLVTIFPLFLCVHICHTDLRTFAISVELSRKAPSTMSHTVDDEDNVRSAVSTHVTFPLTTFRILGAALRQLMFFRIMVCCAALRWSMRPNVSLGVGVADITKLKSAKIFTIGVCSRLLRSWWIILTHLRWLAQPLNERCSPLRVLVNSRPTRSMKLLLKHHRPLLVDSSQLWS